MRNALKAFILPALLAFGQITAPDANAAQIQPAPPARAAPAATATLAIPPGAVRNLTVDQARLSAHVIRPPNLNNVLSDEGPDEGKVNFTFQARPVPQRGPGGLSAPPTPKLDVSAFAEQLHAALKDSVAGYAMQLRQNGNPVATLIWNFSRTPADGSVGWTLDRRMHVASVSKLVTAMAMRKLLAEKNINPDTKIVNYLPAYWQKGQGIGLISFRQLMTHMSGFSTGGSGSDFEFMKQRVAMGVTKNGQYDYENMNFGLCRILIAVINGNIDKDTQFPAAVNDVMWDFITITAYAQYVQQTVFGPAGVTNATLDHPNGTTLAYNFPAAGAGWDSGNLSSVAGGAAWHMTVNELLSVMGTFRRGGKIMPPGQASTMLDDKFGIDLVLDTPAGRLYNKNGLWRDGAGRTEQSLAYFLPEGMELVVFANSPIGASKQFFRDVVTNVYVANLK